MSKIAKRVGLYLACLHFITFGIVALYIARSGELGMILLFLFWIIDFPISLLYSCLTGGYLSWMATHAESIWAYVLYPPHLVHGVLGTIWWYFLPRLVTRRKFGGVWGHSRE